MERGTYCQTHPAGVPTTGSRATATPPIPLILNTQYYYLIRLLED